MTSLAYLACLAWMPVGLFLFSRPNKHRALYMVVILGWLFLPCLQLMAVIPGDPVAISLPGFRLTKLNSIAYAVLAGGLVFDRQRWLAFRPGRIDLPMIVFCLCPMASSLTNDLGLYDGLSNTVDQIVAWGALYWAGRVYVHTLDELRELVLWILWGALLYLPFCWAEMRLSPMLHMVVYGFHQHEFQQSIRFGGYRPMAFLPHGLVVAMWTVTSGIFAYWLWRCGTIKGIGGFGVVKFVPISWAVGLLALTALACRSMGAVALGLLGVMALSLSRQMQSALLVLVLALLPPVYIAARATGAWTGEDLVAFIRDSVSESRADSLGFRMSNENLLTAKALEMPVFGWGGWGRSRVYDETGRDISVTDGDWILILGERGLVGLTAWVMAMLLPTMRFLRDIPPRLWADPRIAPLSAMAVVTTLGTVNNLLNVDNDPTYLVGMGAMLSVVEALTVRRPAPQPQPSPAHARSAIEEPAPA
jgi:hypothetical protein